MTHVPAAWTVGAIALVCLLTLLLGMLGLRLSRTTSDFYVASRAVTPWRNASAIGGEYLSAASFLGVAGLIYTSGLNMLWFPVGYTLGYLVLLVLVAAPLRRSGAYTLPDFAEARLENRNVRRLCSVMVVLIGWLYLLPQLQGAGLALNILVGAPPWIGALVVSTIVAINVFGGGMRAITLVQATQYWVKLVAIALPAFLLIAVWFAQGQPAPRLPSPSFSVTGGGDESFGAGMYSTYSTMLALCLGTMGLPHVVVRYYTNPDGAAARRTTLVVISLLGLFYLFPPVYGVLGHALMADLPSNVSTDSIVLLLPSMAIPGWLGDAMTALLAGGAFAAFLSTASGLTIAVAGVLDQDLVRPRLVPLTGGDVDSIQTFRASTVVATFVPFVIVLAYGGLGLATTVGLAFAVAASTFCPLLVLGVWWRRLSVLGALAGLATGGITSLLAVVLTVAAPIPSGWARTLLLQPAAWTVPLAFAVTVVVSLLTPDRVPPGTLRTMVRLHTPESAKLSMRRT
jgi:cation/acetate symporter